MYHKRRAGNPTRFTEDEHPPVLPEILWDEMLAVPQYGVLQAERAQLIQTLHGSRNKNYYFLKGGAKGISIH